MSGCPQLSIGLVAYGVTPKHVMVRVPNERGRWVLTDWCVAVVPCELCGAIAGEPCHNRKHGALLRYGVGTHARRRDAAARKHGHAGYRRVPPHKLRLTPADLAEATSEPAA